MVEHLFGKEEVPSSNLGGGSRSLSSAVELLPYKQAVTGSIPVATIDARHADSMEGDRRGSYQIPLGELAQLVERLLCKQDVRSSSLLFSIVPHGTLADVAQW